MSLENFLEKMFCVFLSSTARMERQTGQKVERNFREAAINYDDKDKESVEAYKKAKENVTEFQQKKAEFDRNHAALQYEYDNYKARQKGDIQAQKMAGYHYQVAMDKATQEQRNINQMKQSSDRDIQERREFFNVTLPKMVDSIVSSETAVKKVFRADEADNNSEESDQGKQQYKKEDFAEKVESEEEKRSNSASQNNGTDTNTEIPTSSNNIKLCRGSKRNLRQHHRTSRNDRRRRDSCR